MRPLAAAVLAVALAVPLVPARALAQDADADGVADTVDACPDSGAHALVDASGCDVCGCREDAALATWSSRGAYLRCVYDEVRARREAGMLTRKAARTVVKAARHSTCGQATKIRCCIMFAARDEGLCRVLDEIRCDEELLRAETVEDLGPGSCMPNPCLH